MSKALFLLGIVSIATSAPTTSLSSSGEQPMCSNNQLVLQFLPPHYELHTVAIPDLVGVNRLAYQDISNLYTYVLESFQLEVFLKAKMSNRICELPPHHPCFLTERNPATLVYNSTEPSMHLERLAADLCMLNEFPQALANALSYEEKNHSGEFSDDIRNIRVRVGNILEGLANITGISLPTGDSPTEQADSKRGVVYPDTSPSISGSHRNSRDTHEENDNAIPPPPSTVAPSTPPVPTDPSDRDLLNQGNDDTSDSRSASRGRRNVDPETDSPPTDADIPPRCSYPQNDADQFSYIRELWLSLWYISLDLRAIRDILSPH